MTAHQPETHRERDARARARHQRIQEQLDEALAATFPASDPVSIVTSQNEEDWPIDMPEDEEHDPKA